MLLIITEFMQMKESEPRTLTNRQKCLLAKGFAEIM